MEIIVCAPEVHIPAADAEVHCVNCWRSGSQRSMRFRPHYGGFWECRDVIGCRLRSHFAVCPMLFSRTGRASTFCQFCMAGTRFQPGSLVQRGARRYAIPHF